MKILFLDMDGVMNTPANYAGTDDEFGLPPTLERWARYVSPDHVARLNRVLAITGAAVVISSSWRCALPWRDIREVLQSRGFAGTIIGSLPVEPTDDRCTEIKRWLDRMGKVRGVTVWAIVDDSDYDGFVATGRFVQTDGSQGMTDDDADRLIELLGAAS